METLSIGAIVRLTGISADTLRTWERRYGFPTPQRNESGHRRYARSEFERLVKVKGLVAQGHRPSEVIRMTDEDLARAVGQVVVSDPVQPAVRRGLSLAQRASELSLGILLKVEKLQAQGIEHLLDVAWQEMGPHAAVEHVLAPTLVQVGARWRTGRLGVHHEHLFSARVSSFLTRHWQPLSDRNRGPLVVMATPPGEEHELGLHIAATMLTLAGARILFLGQNTPSDAVLTAIESAQADAVAVSVSVQYPRVSTEAYLSHLLSNLSAERVMVGGGGARGGHWPCMHPGSFEDVQAWVSGAMRPMHQAPYAGAPHMGRGLEPRDSIGDLENRHHH